ncbi:MAG: SCP2 domain-containing protein [Gammaproteobacteria bacterium]
MNRPRAARDAWSQRLPGLLLRPFGVLPAGLTRQGFALTCNRIFAAALAAGELDVLEGRVLAVEVRDADIELRLSAQRRRLIVPDTLHATHVRIGGNAYEFLLLVSRREDPDTLFFQRRLRIEGDTELGLHLKNFLDAWEPPAGVRVLQRGAAALLDRMSPLPG